MAHNRPLIVVIQHNSNFTYLFKTLRSISISASNANITDIKVMILGNANITSFEHALIEDIPLLQTIKSTNLEELYKYVQILFITSSTLVSKRFFSLVNRDSVISVAKYVIRFGDRYTIDRLIEPGYPIESISNLFVDDALKLGVLVDSVLLPPMNQVIGGGANEVVNWVLCNNSELIYTLETVTFVRYDKFLQSYECPVSNFLERSHLERLLLRMENDSHLETLPIGVDQEDVEFEVDSPITQTKYILTNSVMKDWSDSNLIEPQIRPSKVMLENILIESNDEYQRQLELFMKIKSLVMKEKYTSIIIAPDLKPGGVTKAVTLLSRELSDKGDCLLILTNDKAELNDIDVDIEVISLDTENDARHGFELLLLSLRPNNIHIINSQAGYKFAAKYNRNNRPKNIGIYIHTYALVIEDGFKIPPFHNALSESYEGVDGFITDSESYALYLTKTYGVPSSIIRTIYLPVAKLNNPKTDYVRKSTILWVGRVCKEKKFRAVLEVALQFPEVYFDIYGPIDESYILVDEINTPKNVNYRGVYKSLEELDLNNYDMLLFTSVNEGMPNVLIEFASAGLFCIASNVGGVHEVIDEGKNGLLIEDDDASEYKPYVLAIKKAYQDELYSSVADISNSIKVIENNHNISKYRKQIEDLIKSKDL